MIPTFSLGSTSNDIFCSAGSMSCLYLITTSLNNTEPSLGHLGGAILSALFVSVTIFYI